MNARHVWVIFLVNAGSITKPQQIQRSVGRLLIGGACRDEVGESWVGRVRKDDVLLLLSLFGLL